MHIFLFFLFFLESARPKFRKLHDFLILNYDMLHYFAKCNIFIHISNKLYIPSKRQENLLLVENDLMRIWRTTFISDDPTLAHYTFRWKNVPKLQSNIWSTNIDIRHFFYFPILNFEGSRRHLGIFWFLPQHGRLPGKIPKI